jgi:hypothetical protein
MKISCDGLPVSEHWWLIILGLVIIEIILEKVSSEFRAQCEESQIACDFIRKGVGMMPSVQKKTLNPDSVNTKRFEFYVLWILDRF